MARTAEQRARHREYQRQYRAKYPDRVRQSQRAWREANPEYHAEWGAINPGKVQAKNRKWREANPERAAVHDQVRTHLTAQPCEVCGTTDHIHAHHEDYSKPLEVVWLCAKHHAEVHYG